MKNVVKYYAYSDKFVMGSIYVINMNVVQKIWKSDVFARLLKRGNGNQPLRGGNALDICVHVCIAGPQPISIWSHGV